MTRPMHQSMKCLKQDADWLVRIRKRARDNETRSPENHARILEALKTALDIIQEELDADARGRARPAPSPERKSSKTDRRSGAQEGGE